MSAASEGSAVSPGEDGAPKRQKLRRRFTGLFVFLAVIALMVAVVGAWARSVVLDTDRFVATVGPAIEDPNVQAALSTRLTDGVMEGLQIEDRVSETLSNLDQGRLPVSPALLAAPITEGIRDRLLARTEQLLASDQVESLWNSALTRAHTQLVALLRGESERATIEGEAVYVDLLPFINDALASLEQQLSELLDRSIDVPTVTEDNLEQVVATLEQQFGVDLPSDFGRVKVFESDALPAAQSAVVAADRLVFLLVIMAIVLAVIAIVLSPRRLRTVMWLALGAAFGLIVIRRLALRIDDAIVDRVSGATERAAVGSVSSDVFADLRSYTVFLLVAAILIGLGAYLAGRPRWLAGTIERAGAGTLITRESPTVRWVGEHATALQVALAMLAAAVLFFANLGWASLLIVVALVAAGWFALSSSAIKWPGRPTNYRMGQRGPSGPVRANCPLWVGARLGAA